MLPSRCVRCGAASRDFLCASCVDFLVADRPLWLDPGLLPGPSLLDLTGTREVAVLGTDLSHIEWRKSTAEPSAQDGIRLVRLLHLDAEARSPMSVGDAEVLHTFLRDARRSSPTDPEVRAALASVCRYLGTREWAPPHLASEYRLRASVLEPPVAAQPRADTGIEESQEPLPSFEDLGPQAPAASAPPVPEVPAERAPAVEARSPPPTVEVEPEEERVTLPAPQPFPPDPVPRPDPPLPLPEPSPVPEPQPEPEPEPEELAAEAALRAELEETRRTLDRARAETEAFVRSRTEELTAKEQGIAGREAAIASKEEVVEARAHAAAERLAGLEKDTARREVLRFLTTVPGVSLDQADVIATAFPDMASLGAADAKALAQCKGVTAALARAIRLELAPGEVEQEQRATRLREEAQGFIEEGEYRAALDCYDRLLRERPEDVAVWFDRAELLVLLDRPEEALQCYTRIVDVDRGNRQAWYERANLLFGLGRLADAVPALREALRIEPSRSVDVVQKAEQLRRDRHASEAVSLFQAVLEVAPDDPRATLGLGDAFLDLGDSEAAEVLFTRALGKNPQNAPILHRKGALLDQKGRWGAAIQYYNRAIALQWNFPDPWLAKGRILLTHDHPKEALECFEKAAAFDPKRIAAWAGQARAQAVLGNAREARAALAKATELGPDDPEVREAREALAEPGSEAQPAPPSHEGAPDLSSLAKAFEAIEDEPEPAPTSASVDFQSFVESVEPDREDAQVLLQLAELAMEGGDPQMALLRYEQALEKQPRNADAWTGKGIVLQHLERYREALEAYDRALSLKPDHGIAQKWRATCVRHLEREASD